MAPPTVLLTNDDGPPHPIESPYVLGLYRHLVDQLGWNVKVVLPSAQKSWIGKAYHIKEVTKGSYFYPRHDGQGETSSRPGLSNLAEWILLDGTPATCTNVALHNLYHGQIDLVISGPNLGRNTSSAFALSSGTIGAALSGSLSKVRSIAISYGTMVHPTPTEYFDPAHILGTKVIKHLWDNWGVDDTVGPDAVEQKPTNLALLPDNSAGDLLFKWAPEMKGLITPSSSSLPEGSDGWAIHKGYVSVTPLRASFGEPTSQVVDAENRLWKLKL
ncbi:survival protein sure-like phosphatase/nucleotidase [Cyathus striatus]|nr:survival protein sure-like phosphatase/nucleotidase [Cyathus striatus]